MKKAERAAEILQDLLKDSELLSYLFKERPAIVRNSFADTLDVISERATGASIPKNGRPKKQRDIQVPNWDQFVSELVYIANLALDGEVGVAVKKRMTPRPEEHRERPRKSRRDRAYEREQAAEKFSPQLLCAVIVGVAYSAVSTDAHWSKRQLKFTEKASEACEMLWRAAGGEEHDEHRNEGGGEEYKIYPTWEEDWIRAARETSCRDLVRDVSRSFR
jgi:hypothetical protein